MDRNELQAMGIGEKTDKPLTPEEIEELARKEPEDERA